MTGINRAIKPSAFILSAFCLCQPALAQTPAPVDMSLAPLPPTVAKPPQGRIPARRHIRGTHLSSHYRTGVPTPQTGSTAIVGTPAGPKVVPVAVGPLASVGNTLEAAGIKAHLFFLDVGFNNLNTGVRRGYTSNDGFLIAGLDFDMNRIAGIYGGAIHVEEDVIPYVTGNGIAGATGDMTAGFIPFYNPTASKFAELTYEQKLVGDKLDVEVGRSNMSRAFNAPICGNLSTCYNNVFFFDANGKVSSNAEWSGRVAYSFSPSLYIQAGAYEDNPQSINQDGLVFDGSTSTGILTLGEIGYKTNYSTVKYPERYEVIGFYTTSNRVNPVDVTQVEHGTGGFILNAQKVIWRADGGLEDNPHPTSIVAYGSVSGSPNAFAPVTFEAYGGLTWQAPLQSRPFDNLGFKIHWTELSSNRQAYLQVANLAAGGTGYNKSRNSVGFEVNAHVQLAQYVAIEPTLSYYANANNFFAPNSAVVARDGFFVGGILSVGLGQALGLSSSP